LRRPLRREDASAIENSHKICLETEEGVISELTKS
jgi:hypothetical protein